MALGDSNMNVRSGGGTSRVGSAVLAKTMVQLGCSTLGQEGVVARVADVSRIPLILDDGPLAKAIALRHAQGITSYGVPLPPSQPGAIGDVVHQGTGAGQILVSAAPHKLVEIVVSKAGVLGTMQIRTRVGGTGAFSQPVTSVAVSSNPWVYRVPGTFCHVTFPAASYDLNATLTIGTDGSVQTSGGTATAGAVLASAGPYLIRPGQHFDVKVDEGGALVFTFGGTRGFTRGAAGGFAGYAGSMILRLNEDATSDQTITFAGTENTVAKALALINAQWVGGHAIDDGTGQIKLESDRYGTSSHVRVVSGDAGLLTAIGLATGLGTAGSAAVDSGTGAVQKSIAFLDAATAAELAVALVVTGATLSVVAGALKVASQTTGGAPKGVQVQGTSTQLLGCDTVEHNGAAAGTISACTFTADPIDTYEVELTINKGGLPGVAILGWAVDAGISNEGSLLVPASGVVVLPGTGLVLTCSSLFVATEVYSFPTVAPTCSDGELTAALDALRSDASLETAHIHVVDLPPSAAEAFSRAALLQSECDTADESNHKFWQASCEGPCAGDIVVSGGKAIVDVADTDAVIMAARLGLDFKSVTVHFGTHAMVAPRKQRRPLGWAVMQRFAITEPREDISAPVPYGPLPIYKIGRDEAVTPGLDDVGLNTARTYGSEAQGAFLSITSGGFGWKNLTSDASFADACGVRGLNCFLHAQQAAGFDLLGQRPPANPDGTIEEKAASAWEAGLDANGKRSVGLLAGGDFTEPQASTANSTISRGSQLGASPHRLDILYKYSPLGFVSDVEGDCTFSGTLTIGG